MVQHWCFSFQTQDVNESLLQFVCLYGLLTSRSWNRILHKSHWFCENDAINLQKTQLNDNPRGSRTFHRGKSAVLTPKTQPQTKFHLENPSQNNPRDISWTSSLENLQGFGGCPILSSRVDAEVAQDVSQGGFSEATQEGIVARIHQTKIRLLGSLNIACNDMADSNRAMGI